MKRAWTYAEVRAAEKQAIAGGASVSALMQRAGSALADAVGRAMERLGITDALFVCGGGNNGGDGEVAAKILFERGLDVAILRLSGTTSSSCPCEVMGRIPRRRYALIVDCLFGTGLSRPIAGAEAELVDFINHSGAYVIACDVPSGLSRGGVAEGSAVRADETLTMGCLKAELLLSDGADLSGEVSVADIGLSFGGGAEIWEEEDIRALFPKRKSHTNKGDYGAAAILAGDGTLGAPLLAAGACLKSGAGYTKLYLPALPSPEGEELRRTVIAAKYPACIVKTQPRGPLSCKSCEAVAFGMGAGVSAATESVLRELLSTYAGTLVLDADALNTLAACGTDMLHTKKCRVIVTPHIKEFSRLTGKTTEEIVRDPIGCAREFSKEYAVTVLLKNNRSVIAEGDRVAINTTGSATLAKGGSGDALAGFLAGTCARGTPPFEAAVCAAFLSGRAGELAAGEMGEYAPDAEDVIARLPLAMPRG